ncbi:6,7-dimethyl-8-ribityllumazine synthase [Actinocrinis puniceicyclus]|uniref:6,7-dimethyl-8-ribityllumazine synthase n=1 Tax=Actinocrinis puniceicyclus TaxID=977794 RepID=A0A8J8BGU5_9ACTN|nr:6,7-dimethyl-8-ribityllumazine synthase [Actinocrinis puniceicyclus]MBS2966129.1 6,7-dimethyl-8-ribityllumazine synthase [Actinocrinis puniceicyclus]
MSGTGAPQLVVDPADLRKCAQLRVGIVAAQWHTEVMDALLDNAREALAEIGIAEPRVLRVPGCFELPVAAYAMAKRRYDAIIALGVVVRGGTPHFEYVCRAATDGLAKLAVESGIPVGFGVLTCDTEQQALDRAGLPGSAEDKGREAALSAVATALTLKGLGEH